MAEYTLAAMASVVAVVAAELLWLRTGVFARSAYWWAMGICFAFMVPVDGWLTKLSAPIVLYDPDQRTSVRIPWDIPVEDYLFGFSLLTLVVVLWYRAAGPGEDDAAPLDGVESLDGVTSPDGAPSTLPGGGGRP